MTLIHHAFPICNDCDKYYSGLLDYRYSEYYMRKHMKESGWKSEPIPGTGKTHDVCPDCVKKQSAPESSHE